jgi:hypothetical protein
MLNFKDKLNVKRVAGKISAKTGQHKIAVNHRGTIDTGLDSHEVNPWHAKARK